MASTNGNGLPAITNRAQDIRSRLQTTVAFAAGLRNVRKMLNVNLFSMKREIKFRKWDGCEMIQLSQMNAELNDFNCDDFPIMQLTGLKDKNGKEIYEGDIVEFISLSEEYRTGIVFYKDGCYRLKNFKNLEFRQWNDGNHEWYSIENVESFEIEVIGNIHENTELCESEN